MKLPFSPIIFYISFVILLSLGTFLYIDIRRDQKEIISIIETLITSQETELAQTQAELSLLRAENEVALLEKEAEIEAQQSELESLSSRLTTLQNQPIPEVGNSTSDIVLEWKDSIFKVSCSFVDVIRSRRITQSGSGIGLNLSDGAIFMTNKHVLTRDGASLESCSLRSASGDTLTLPLENFRVDPDLDFAFTLFEVRQSYFNKTLTNGNICNASTVEQGEPIAILGYPITGAQNSITVTEGIISGFESDYYVTSAKIEQGNSGGGAILTSQSCILGLPTFAQVGKVESLARILKLEKLIDL